MAARNGNESFNGTEASTMMIEMVVAKIINEINKLFDREKALMMLKMLTQQMAGLATSDGEHSEIKKEICGMNT